MKRMLIMVLALSMVAVLALPALAEVQNIKVTGSIVVRGFYRDSYGTTGSGTERDFQAGNFTSAYGERDWYNTQTQLGVSADLTDNVAANILIANERDWNVSGAGNSTTIALQCSYITLKEMLYSPLTVKIGKMPISIADRLIIGDGSTGTASNLMGSDYDDDKAFDAIIGTLDYEPLTLGLGIIKYEEGASLTSNDDADVYFINSIYSFEDDMNTVLDISLFNVRWSKPDSGHTGLDASDTAPITGSTNAVNFNTLAAVLTAEPMESLFAKLGIALQQGDYMIDPTANVSRDLDAMAMDLDVNYAIDAEYSPKVGLKYVYRSGQDPSKTTGDYEQWQAMFEDQCNGIIYDPNSNISAIALTASAVPADRLTVSAAYWLYTLDEAVAASGTRTNDDEAGQELDLAGRYAYTEDVSMGLELAWFFPGNSYASGSDKTASQVMLELGVKF